jgi:hypothetical protein
MTREVQPGLEWVLEGKGEATEKVDGAACAIIGGVLYKRYDAKWGKFPPVGAIPCQPSEDPRTGHWPHWVKVDYKDPASYWHIVALENALNDADGHLNNGTYEAVGPHFQGNPHHLEKDTLIRHGITVLDVPRTFEGLRDYLEQHEIEGIVFWKDEEPQCKIKRSDFGFKWPL